MVRSKMRCNAILPSFGGDAVVELHAVYSTDPESPNKAFTDATPSASVRMQIAAGKPALDQFVIGKEYFVDFTPAE